jgi:diguanylate cyclase (GGDEF)-like protein
MLAQAAATSSGHPVTPAWRRAHAGSGVTSGLILAYVQREAGRDGVEELLATAGLSEREQELRDENCWFSFETKIRLWEAAEAVTADRRIAEHVGEAALQFTIALALKQALRALGSPEFVYRNIPRANSKFNWAHTVEVIEHGRDFVRLEYRDVSGVGYHRYDCDYTIGLLRTVPQLFGLPAARVTQPMCGSRGENHCQFEVHWVGGLQRTKRRGMLAAGFAVALAAAGFFVHPVLIAEGVGFGAATAAVAATRAAMFAQRRIEALESRIREQDMAARAQLDSLAALSSQLRLDEVLDSITANARHAIGGTQFALLVAEAGAMRADRFSEIPAESLHGLELWAQGCQQALRNGSIVIDDVASVPALGTPATDEHLPFGSACAAPLIFRDRLLGVLIALAPGARVFLPADVRALETYAGHAAIALWNARLVDQLEREAAEDPLTGLANKRTFHSACEVELRRAAHDDGSVALVVLDIDHFKEINDTFGHPFGDQVLVAVAEALREAVREYDTIARLGGEEFALLLPGTTLEQARSVAERARELIAAIELPDTRLSSSAGVAAATGVDAPASDLLNSADEALYDAKRQGRGRTTLARAT